MYILCIATPNQKEARELLQCIIGQLDYAPIVLAGELAADKQGTMTASPFFDEVEVAKWLVERGISILHVEYFILGKMFGSHWCHRYPSFCLWSFEAARVLASRSVAALTSAEEKAKQIRDSFTKYQAVVTCSDLDVDLMPILQHSTYCQIVVEFRLLADQQQPYRAWISSAFFDLVNIYCPQLTSIRLAWLLHVQQLLPVIGRIQRLTALHLIHDDEGGGSLCLLPLAGLTQLTSLTLQCYRKLSKAARRGREKSYLIDHSFFQQRYEADLAAILAREDRVGIVTLIYDGELTEELVKVLGDPASRHRQTLQTVSYTSSRLQLKGVQQDGDDDRAGIVVKKKGEADDGADKEDDDAAVARRLLSLLCSHHHANNQNNFAKVTIRIAVEGSASMEEWIEEDRDLYRGIEGLPPIVANDYDIAKMKLRRVHYQLHVQAIKMVAVVAAAEEAGKGGGKHTGDESGEREGNVSKVHYHLPSLLKKVYLQVETGQRTSVPREQLTKELATYSS